MDTALDPHALFLPFLLRVGAAILCGGLLGIERELRGKPAGLRTNVLICLGAALYMIISELVVIGPAGESIGDRGRIAAQVVTGIGFLGGGAILQARGIVTGLTTAATIWADAAIGLCVGAGFISLALVFSLVAVATLVVLRWLEKSLLGRCHFVPCEITYADERTREQLLQLIDAHGEKAPSPLRLELGEDGGGRMVVECCDSHPQHRSFVVEIWKLTGIRSVRVLRGQVRRRARASDGAAAAGLG